jgi:hypothetical protein
MSVEQTTEKGQMVSVGSDAWFGKFVRAGTMTVSGEEVTGYVVATSVEELRAMPRLPMYRTVAIIEAPAWVETQRKIGFLLGALEGLRWSVEGEVRKKIDAILAEESSPNTGSQTQPPNTNQL